MTRRRRRVFQGGTVAGPDGQLAGRVRLKLKQSEAVRVRELLAAGYTQREVASELGIPYRRLRDRLVDQLRLRVGRGRKRRGMRRAPFPFLSDEEIAARTAEIRAAWTPEREAEAWVGGGGRNIGGSSSSG